MNMVMCAKDNRENVYHEQLG